MARQPNGSRKWRSSQWKLLLELVLPALNELPKKLTWSLGGGTALSISLNHRVSYDIDIFFQDASALNFLSPHKNKKIRALSDDWQHPGNYLNAVHFLDPIFIHSSIFNIQLDGRPTYGRRSGCLNFRIKEKKSR